MSRAAELAEWVWHGSGIAAAVMRRALTPASALFSAVVARRNRRFDAGVGVKSIGLPAISVGNLTVGGTGKTPVAAWCARTLQEMGGRPAIVMRGYGDDEWRVHALLNPDVPVETDADRVRGMVSASLRGADCAVLDDAFQHRRAVREADLVLIAADAWTGHVRTLPTGPWREPLTALRRASVAVITAKSASAERVEQVQLAIRAAAPAVPIAVVGIVPERLRLASGDGALWVLDDTSEPLELLSGRRITAVSAIGDPASFERQLSTLGATLRAHRFRDHHAFSHADVARILASVDRDGMVVCTLKDAVKLAPLWPRAAPPLWYVSQTIEVRLGWDALHEALQRVLSARNLPHAASRPTAG
mgnify:CR=1 FL=1